MSVRKVYEVSHRVKSGVRSKRLMSICELAEYLQVSKNTIYSWVWQKRIPYTKIGHLLRFDVVAIDEWIQRHSVEVFEAKSLDDTIK